MYLILLLVVFALFGVFAVQNPGTHDFSLLGYTWNLPMWAPAAIGTGIVSVLLLLHMSHAGLGSHFREFGHSRALDEHRGTIEGLRAENGRLREELAAMRGAAAANRPRQRSFVDEVRDLPNRVRNRVSTG